MKAQKLSNGSLVVAEGWPLLRAGCVIGGCLLPATLLFAELGNESINYGRIIGGALGALLLFLVAAVVDNRRFVFDLVSKTLTWEQKNWLRSRGGRLPFSEIRDVLVIYKSDTSNDSNRRYDYYSAVLDTTRGRIPLTATSSRSKHDYDEVAKSILALLGKTYGDGRAERS